MSFNVASCALCVILMLCLCIVRPVDGACLIHTTDSIFTVDPDVISVDTWVTGVTAAAPYQLDYDITYPILVAGRSRTLSTDLIVADTIQSVSFQLTAATLMVCTCIQQGTQLPYLFNGAAEIIANTNTHTMSLQYIDGNTLAAAVLPFQCDVIAQP